MVAGEEGKWPDVCAAAWPQWWREHQERVKRRTAKRNAESLGEYRKCAITELCLWYMYRSLKPLPQTGADPGSWWCRVCDKTFRSKANLAVHFFKVHGRCAEYRKYITSTSCGACGKEFWTLGRVEDHLRASVKCVRQLQRRNCPGSTTLPGYGSRKTAGGDNFTPAAPTAATEVVEVLEEQPWTTWQRQLYCELCDVVLDQPVDDTLGEALWRKTCKYPLFTEELQQVVEVLIGEAKLIEWTATQFEQLIIALAGLSERMPQRTDETQRGSATLQSRMAFSRSVQTLNWGEVIHKWQEDYVTGAFSLYTLSAEILSFCCPRHCVSFGATFYKEGIRGLRHHGSFWAHPLAIAFVPFRVDVCT